MDSNSSSKFISTLPELEVGASIPIYPIPEIKAVLRENASQIPMQTVFVNEEARKNGFGYEIPKNVSFKSFSMQYVKFRCPHCGPNQHQSDAALYPILPVIFCFAFVPNSVYYTPRFEDKDERVTTEMIQKRKDNFHREWHRDLAHELKSTMLEFHKVGMCSKIIYLPIMTKTEQRNEEELFLAHTQLALETKRLGMVNYLVFENNIRFEESRIPSTYRAIPSGSSPLDIRNTISISMSNYICSVIMDIPWQNTFCLYLGGKINKLDWAHSLFNRHWIQNGILFGGSECFGTFLTRHWQNFVAEKLTSYIFWLKSPSTLSDIVSRPENKLMYYPPICKMSLILAQGETYIMTPTIVTHTLVFTPNALQLNQSGLNIAKISEWLKSKISWTNAETIHNGIMSWLGFVIIFLGILVFGFLILCYGTRKQLLLKQCPKK